MLLERNGKSTMWKSKSSRLSYSLVESLKQELKQELVYATIERQRRELGLENINGRLAFCLIKSTVTRGDSH